MKKLAFIFLCLMCTNVYAEDENYEMYSVDQEDPILTPQDEEALELVEKIKNRKLPLSEGNNGYVRYVFGYQTPRVLCSPMRICDIKLQVGEQINSLNSGDSTRWLIEPSIEGVGDNEIQHIIIKPSDIGLETNIIVTTNRRVYHIELASTKTKNITKVEFTYPEEAYAKFNYLTRQKLETKEKNTLPTGEYLGNLDFEYEIIGDQYAWRPVRIYNDGKKTIIEMNKEMNNAEAPSLLVTRYSKNSKETDQLVNYRLQNNKFIVDGVFYECMLINGVGSEQEKITIRRSK